MLPLEALDERAIQAETAVRLIAAVTVFVLMAAWELARPRRARVDRRLPRWRRNLGMAALNVLFVQIGLPISVLGTAELARARDWGLLNRFELPGPLEVVLAVLGLDAAIYAQHALFHAVPVLWRLHRVHHADRDLDVTTGVRFHPGEIVISALIKMGVVAILGASPAATLVFAILLNATSLFNHANVRVGRRLEPILRGLVVTPDMHRVHHSVLAAEQNSNFGFSFPYWDRLFGTYRPRPRDGHEGMTIGLDDLPEAGRMTFGQILALPFRPVPGR